MIQIKTLNKHGRDSEKTVKFKNMVRQEVSFCLQSPYNNLERSAHEAQEAKVPPLGVCVSEAVCVMVKAAVLCS